MKKISLWVGNRYEGIINSIAFYPALIAILFLVFGFAATAFDLSATGKQIKQGLPWLSLKDATTARSIISTITGSIISLAVFSFSMVLIILNQTASQLSNRILDKLIGNRFQQIVLGFYVGTIVFALYLQSTIRDIDSGVNIPALSTYALIFVTILDIFLFLYFLHYITQSVKYEVIIHRIENETLEVMEDCCEPVHSSWVEEPALTLSHSMFARKTGIYEGFNRSVLRDACEDADCVLEIIPTRGDFIFTGQLLCRTSKVLSEEALKDVYESFYIHHDESVSENFFYGFRQLTEVAMKALSPGINDPATAVQSLRALYRLFEYRQAHEPHRTLKDKDGKLLIITREKSYAEMFEETFLPIWHYGKSDILIQNEMYNMLSNLKLEVDEEVVTILYQQVAKAVAKRKKDFYDGVEEE